VVNTTVTDIIGPSVTTDDEDDLVGEVVLQLVNLGKHCLLFGIGNSHCLYKGGLDSLPGCIGSFGGLFP